MAYKNSKIKPGMGGSRGGKSRWEKTGVLKHQSKTLRRELDKEAVKEQQEEGLFEFSSKYPGSLKMTKKRI